MKNFKNYTPEKYSTSDYKKIEDGIYQTKDPYFIEKNRDIFVTSLSFEQEPECCGEEGGCPQNITQIPFEMLLDEFSLFVTDFYDEENKTSESICYQEFGAYHLEDIQKLREIIGKRVYAIPYKEEYDEEDEEYEEDEEEYLELVMEESM